ncbi:HD domain-containing protein [Streptomyces hiroshimensis]|uniref:Caspase family protein n=1 Tax=Streptomyces hiroshimensis TaxID=66424 RepID=A0ABQ2Y4V2_9ACTN|nr:caspase family protein [Streptomyces hiroshimensis]GGX65359.1 hypothetical protein GCM10010324_07960 [Streptomyces hiroshimensis]
MDDAPARRALLIGVPAAPDALGEFEPLDEPVAADLRAMQTSLEESGYEVAVLAGPGRGAMATGVFEAARSVPEGGTLLLYFTGHGVRIGGKDYLVPADARAPQDGRWQPPYLDTLLSADIGQYLQESRAGTVLWLVDACRNPSGGLEDAFGSGILTGPAGSRFAVMVGCSPGQRCGYAAEGSFFTRGLAGALGSLSAPQTVQKVYEAARARTERAARRHGLDQRVWIRYGTDREEETRAAVVCNGRRLLEEWRDAVRDERLWKLAGAEECIPRLQEALLVLVESCAVVAHRAQQRLPDPWADEDFPVRLLRRGLLPLLSHAPGLSAVEVTALIAAPFLREAAWAWRLAQAAEAGPLTPGRTEGAGEQRRHLEQLRDHYAHVARKQAACRGRGRTEDEHALALWLVHRWIAERFETDEEPVPGSLCEEFAASVLDAGDGDPARVEELSATLAALAAGIGVDVPLDEGQDCPAGAVRLGECRQPLRVRPLTALLRLAAALAADVRTFPDIIADHLAVTDPVLPEDVVKVARHGLDWTQDTDGLHLDVLCPHQAVHAALAEIAERADRLAALTRGLAAGLPSDEAALLAVVPARVTARGLRPRGANGRKAYEVPLLRFHLAQTEVRELLMGRQLYGDPGLALRELYQNAMDACRYRAMRWDYLRCRGREPARWSGRITLVEGSDERGRYVECRDNGVGMGLEQLKNTFTRAGSRFEQSRAFRREQASWLRRDPSLRLYPNSRFGIGVLSYFMLADEMTIVTRQVGPTGAVAAEALRVDIPSSGSLFRVQRHDDDAGDGVPEGGTRVRLYLRDEEELEGLSCVAKARELIGVCDFRFEARDECGAREVWEQGVLRGRRASCEAVPGVLWWVDGEGAILCDGVATDRKPYGYVLNLTGVHAGTLSVDRNRLLDFDETWAGEKLREGAGALADWPGLTMEWLWGLESKSLPVAAVVWGELRGKGLRIPREAGSRGAAVALDTVGWFRGDAGLLQRRRHQSELLDAWRLTAWGAQSRSVKKEAFPAELTGYSVPEPGFAAVVQGNDRGTGWERAVGLAAKAPLPVREVVRALRRMRIAHRKLTPPPHGSEGDRGRVPDNLDLEIIRTLQNSARRRLSGEVRGFEYQDLEGLVLISDQFGVTLGHIAAKCRDLAYAWRGPEIRVPEQYVHYVCTYEDVDLLFDFPGGGKLAPRPVRGPWQARQVADLRNLSLESVLERMAAFSWLGWPELSAAEAERWRDVDAQVVALLGRYGRTPQGGRPEVGWKAALALAADRRISLGAAEAEVKRWADHLGVTYQRLVPGGTLNAEAIPSSEVAGRYGEILTAEGEVRLSAVMSLKATARALDGMSADLRQLGVRLPDNLALLPAWEQLPVRTRVAFCGEDPLHLDIWGGIALRCPAPVLTLAVLLSACAHLHEPLGDVWKLACEEARRFGIGTPDMPADFLEYRVSKDELVLLNTWRNKKAGTPQWTPLTPHRLASYAHGLATDAASAYDRLVPLRALGALVPELGADELDVLRACSPDERDLLALGDEFKVSGPDAPYGPLDLVSIAGRLGESISRTWQRIEPYLPLTLPPEVPDIPDVLPLWQDLAVLSLHLDGELPAVGGRIDPDRVRLVAHEIEESEEWVVGRLRLYARMFTLDLTGLSDAEQHD